MVDQLAAAQTEIDVTHARDHLHRASDLLSGTTNAITVGVKIMAVRHAALSTR